MTCDKIGFEKRKDAQEYILNWDHSLGGIPPSRIYKCSKCGLYHMTKRKLRTLWGNDNSTKKKRQMEPKPRDIAIPRHKEWNGTLRIKTNLISYDKHEEECKGSEDARRYPPPARTDE